MNRAAPPHLVNVEAAEDESYRLVAVESVGAPEGCSGPDWFAYRIALGINAITGYRRGSNESVHAEAATIVIALNERREWRNRKNPKVQRKAAAAVRAAAASQAPAGEE